MARSWAGLTILACLPCMGTLQSTEACYSYANCLETEECYQSTVVSRKKVGQTRLPPALRPKAQLSVMSSQARVEMSRPFSARLWLPCQKRSRPEVCLPLLGTKLA